MLKHKKTSARDGEEAKNIILCLFWRRPQHAMYIGKGVND